MMNIVNKLVILNRRKQAAKRLGFNFNRAADFSLPAQICLNSHSVSLQLPEDEGTRTAFVDLLLDDCYRLNNLPKNIGTILDVGAHAGLFSMAARIAFPGATIHAYEPNPQMLPLLSNQSRAGSFSFFGEAVSLAEGRMSLSSGADSVHTRANRTDEGEIHCVSFAQAVERLGGSVDLVKLDCEGAEWEILKDEATWKHVRHLTMEFHLWAGYTLEQLKNRVEQLGFKISECQVCGQDFGLLQATRG